MPRALRWSYGGGAVSYERGTPVGCRFQALQRPDVPGVVVQSERANSSDCQRAGSSSSLLLSSLELSDTKYMRLKYEPASEPLHISVQVQAQVEVHTRANLKATGAAKL